MILTVQSLIGLPELPKTPFGLRKWLKAAGIPLTEQGSQVLDLTFRGFKTVFNDAQIAAPSHYADIAMTVPSTSRDETYGWLGQFPALREWIGPRQVKNLEAHGFTIKNRKFESSLECGRRNRPG